MSNQKATTTVAVQAVTGPVLNKDYQLLLDRLLKLMREQMGERLLAVCLYGSLPGGRPIGAAMWICSSSSRGGI